MQGNRYISEKLLPFAADGDGLNNFRLSIIRFIVLALLLISCVYAAITPSIATPSTGVFVLISAYAFIAIASLYFAPKRSHTNVQLSAQLLLEVVFVGLLAYQTGGAANPFVSYLLVPISIAAASLPRQRAALIAIAAVVVYTLLLFYYQPYDYFSHSVSGHSVSAHSTGTHGAASQRDNLYSNAHYLGMWFNFVVSAGLISWFVTRMAQAIRARDAAITEQREAQMRDEHIVAVASFAAGTAHELGTPVNTLKLLLDDMNCETDASTLQQDIALMRSQVAACETSLHNLVAAARNSQNQQTRIVEIGPWITACVEQWLPLHPELADLPLTSLATYTQRIKVDETLRQAVANILDNASNASSKPFEILLQPSHDDASICITVRDYGSGLPKGFNSLVGPSATTNLGATTNPSTKAGLGIGVMLSNASIERLGGTLSFLNRYADTTNHITGVDACIQLPVYKSTVHEAEK